MSTFRAFQTGLEAGQQQAKTRRQDEARMKATEAYGMGNVEGAVTGLMGAGMVDEANAYGQMDDQRKARARTQSYADAMKTGMGTGPTPDRRAGYEAVSQAAGQQGDFATMQDMDQTLAGMDDNQKAQFGEGMNFLAQTAMGLKNVAPEKRAQEAIAALQNSPYANPQVMAQIERAGADGLITDEEIQAFVDQTMSVADRVKLAKGDKAKYTTATTRDGVIAYNDADPTDKVTLGQAPLPAKGVGVGNGLTTNQALNFQFKLDDLDRELTEKERVRKSSLASINENLALVNRFTDESTPEAKAKFDATYGNVINPTGKKDDVLNWNVAWDQNRADGMAILEQLGGSAFLDSIQAMKGSGSLSDAEGARVTAAATRLMTVTMSKSEARIAAKDFKEKLQRYKTALENDIGDSRKAEVRRRQQLEGMMGRPSGPGGKSAPVQIQGDDDFDALPSGAQFVGPDGIPRVKP